MTTRQFDPVFSAALRNELAALADAQEEVAVPRRRLLPSLRRPQLWISVVTAAVLVAATVGVLRLTHALPQPPAAVPQLVDPLSRLQDPSSDSYVARSVLTLLDVRGTGPGTHAFEVPAGVTSVRTYLNCASSGSYDVAIDGHGGFTSGCALDGGNSSDQATTTGGHIVTVTVGEGVRYSLLLIATPEPTIASGALVDPLTQVRDRRVPDALVGDTTPLLRFSGAGTGGATSIALPVGERARLYFVCRPSSGTARVTVSGHEVTGCMNSIAHWFDFTPTAASVTAQVDAPASEQWSVLVVPAPAGAKDSPANTTLAYPTSSGTLLAAARGAGAPASGTYRRPGDSILITATCRGTGWLEISTADGGTTTRANPCSTRTPFTVGLGSDRRTSSLRAWSVVPHGDISWTFQISTDG